MHPSELDELRSAYYQFLEKQQPKEFLAYQIELDRRLRQMTWFVQRVRDLIMEYFLLNAGIRAMQAQGRMDDVREKAHRQQAVAEEIETLTEAFYWFAFRAQTVVRQFPHLKNFDAVGVRNVRNHLLEHPEGRDSGIIMGGFVISTETGPRLKLPRVSHEQRDRWVDAGLYVNATEFTVRLVEALRRRLQELDARE